MIRTFAAIVDNEVFHEIAVNDDLEYGVRWSAGLLSNPEFINTDSITSICAGATWDGQYFYMPDDLEKQSPIVREDKPLVEKMVRFTGVVDGEAFGTVTFFPDDLTDEMLSMVRAGFSSNPIIIETTSLPLVEVGDIWTGLTFVKPEMS